jgi:hypothetical protein
MDTTLLLVSLVVVLVLAVSVFLFLRGRPKQEESFSHFRCPKCRRRLRYQGRQSGRKGECSNCGHPVTFPPLSESID